MDYMPEDEGGRVFGTNRRKSTLFFDPTDDDTSATKSPANNLPNGHGSTAADKKTKTDANATDTDTPECPMPGCCQVVHDSKLRGHMLTHFQGEVKGAMFAEAKWGICSDTKVCPLCQWDGPEIAHLVVHMGIKHDLLEKVMPEDLLKAMEERLEAEAEKTASQKLEEEGPKNGEETKESEEEGQKANATPEEIQDENEDEGSPEKEKYESYTQASNLEYLKLLSLFLLNRNAADTNGIKETEVDKESAGAQMKPEDKDLEQSPSVTCHLCNFAVSTSCGKKKG